MSEMAGRGEPGAKSWREKALENGKLLDRAKDEIDMLTQKLVDAEILAQYADPEGWREKAVACATKLNDARKAQRASQTAHTASLAEWNTKRRQMKTELRQLRAALDEAERRAEVTLADHYAGHAMGALLGSESDAHQPALARDAFRQAAAMLDVRLQIGEARCAEIREEGRQALKEIGDYFARVEMPEESD